MHAEHADSERLNDPSGRVIGRAFAVLIKPGTGFLTKIHENALGLVLRASVQSVVQQHCVKVRRVTWQSETTSKAWSPLQTVTALDEACNPVCCLNSASRAWS
jgi:hypothetical protein